MYLGKIASHVISSKNHFLIQIDFSLRASYLLAFLLVSIHHICKSCT